MQVTFHVLVTNFRGAIATAESATRDAHFARI